MLLPMDTFLVRVWRPAVARASEELTLCGTVEHLSSRHETTFQTGDDLLTLLDELGEEDNGDAGAWAAPGEAALRWVPGDAGSQPAPGDAGSQPATGDAGSQPATGDAGSQPAPGGAGPRR